MFVCGGQNSTEDNMVLQRFFRICYVILFEYKGPWMLKTTNFVVLCGENMVSKESKIVCSVKVSWLEFVSVPIVDQLQPNF